nr:unnamed protein product [Callosobruchus chinensis]
MQSREGQFDLSVNRP